MSVKYKHAFNGNFVKVSYPLQLCALPQNLAGVIGELSQVLQILSPFSIFIGVIGSTFHKTIFRLPFLPPEEKLLRNKIRNNSVLPVDTCFSSESILVMFRLCGVFRGKMVYSGIQIQNAFLMTFGNVYVFCAICSIEILVKVRK